MGTLRTETAIIGGGLMGCWTAFFLRRRGRPVVVLEKGAVGAQALAAAVPGKSAAVGCRTRRPPTGGSTIRMEAGLFLLWERGRFQGSTISPT